MQAGALGAPAAYGMHAHHCAYSRAHRLAVWREVQAVADEPVGHGRRQRQDGRLEGHPRECGVPGTDLAREQLLHAATARHRAQDDLQAYTRC